MPGYFPEGDTPKPQDNPFRSLQKQVSLGAGGSVSGVTGVYNGNGAPAIVPSGTAADYTDQLTGDRYYWDPNTSTWK